MRTSGRAIIAVGLILVVGALATGCGRRQVSVGWTTPVGFGDPGPAVSASSSASPTLSPRSSPSPSGKPTRKASVAPKPTPTKKPPVSQLPPPPPPPPKPTPTSTSTPAPTPSGSAPSCPTFSGSAATHDQVQSALLAAGGTRFWDGVPDWDMDPNLNGDRPVITIPSALMKAIAWQESSWRSNVIACDGGIGTMQLMPGTVTWMNNRFHTSYAVDTLSGNTSLGAEYLEWLNLYFGLYYFGSYDLNATAPVGPGGSDLMLRDVVIAAYNVGPAAVESDGQQSLSIPNQWYVDNVNRYVTSCPCDAS